MFRTSFGRIIKSVMFEKTVTVFFASVLFLGILIGTFSAVFMSNSDFYEYNAFFESLFSERADISGFDIFFQSFLKYAKTVVVIWFLGYVNIGFFAIAVLIFIKGVGLGFTVSAVIQYGGLECLFSPTCRFIFVQCFFIVPLYIAAAFFSTKFIFYGKSYGVKNYSRQFLFLLPLYLAICFAAAFADVYFA